MHMTLCGLNSKPLTSIFSHFSIVSSHKAICSVCGISLQLGRQEMYNSHHLCLFYIVLHFLAIESCFGYSASSTTISTSLSLGAGEWNITFTGVTLKSTLVINTNAMLTNSTRYITFTNCIMTGTGTTPASIFILGAQPPATSNLFQPPVHILVYNMAATQASILFNGTFPPQTHIDVIGSTITNSGVVTYLGFYAAGLIFSSMSIMSHSYISVALCNFTMTGSTTACPGALGLEMDNLNVTGSSTLIVQNTTITAKSTASSTRYTAALDVTDGLVVSDRSYALFKKLALTAVGSTNGVVVADGTSAWMALDYSAIVIDSCNITFDATASPNYQNLFEFSGGVVVQGHSWFVVRNIQTISIKSLLSVFYLASATYNTVATVTFADSTITHTGASTLFTFYNSVTSPVNDSTFVMVVRCFYLNGALQSTTSQWGFASCTFVACNTCAAQVDCFTPYSAGLAAGVYPACSCNCAHRPSIASLNCLPTYYSTSMTQSATGGGVSSTNTASKTRSVGTRARSGSASTSPGLHSRSASASLTRRKSRSRRSASVSVSRTPQMRSLTGSGTQLHSATSSSSQSHTLGSFPQSLTRSLSKTRSVGTGQRSLTLSGSCVFPSASMSLSSSSTISLSKFKPKSWSKRFSLTPTGSISGDVYYSATSISATPEISASASTTTSRTAGTSHRSASDSKSRTKRSSVTLSLRSSTLSPASSTSRTTPGKGRISRFAAHRNLVTNILQRQQKWTQRRRCHQ